MKMKDNERKVNVESGTGVMLSAMAPTWWGEKERKMKRKKKKKWRKVGAGGRSREKEAFLLEIEE